MNPSADTYKRVSAAAKDVLRDRATGAVLGLLLLWYLPGWLRCCFIFVGSTLFLAGVLGTLVTDFKPRKKVNPSGKSVLVTGCDSGFGHMLATRLDDLGYQVFACCLSPDGDGAQKLQKSTSSRLRVVGLDVTKDEDVQRALDYVKEHLGKNKLWAVVCNAGMNDGAEVLWTNLDTFQKVIDVNFLGTVRVTKAFLPLVCQSKGRVAAVASAAGRLSFQGMSAYCSSKHAVISFCDSLRAEMYKFGVQVSTIEPWMYRTGITEEDAVTAYITKTWNEAPEDVKAFYPIGYLKNYINNVIKFLNLSVSFNPSEVVDCLEEAVTAKNPRYSYGPGTVRSRLQFWVLRRLPQQLFDFIVLGPSLRS